MCFKYLNIWLKAMWPKVFFQNVQNVVVGIMCLCVVQDYSPRVMLMVLEGLQVYLQHRQVLFLQVVPARMISILILSYLVKVECLFILLPVLLIHVHTIPQTTRVVVVGADGETHEAKLMFD